MYDRDVRHLIFKKHQNNKNKKTTKKTTKKKRNKTFLEFFFKIRTIRK